MRKSEFLSWFLKFVITYNSLVVVCTNHFLANSHVLYILSLPFFTCSSLMSQDCDVVLVAARAFWTTRSTPVQHFPRIPTVPYTLQFPSPAPEQEIDEQIRESGHKKKYSSLLGYQRYIRNKLKQIIFYFFLWCACINLLVDFKIKKITSRQLSWNINCVHRLQSVSYGGGFEGVEISGRNC